MLEIRGIWLCHMSRWDRYVLPPRIWMETSRSGTVPHIGPYKSHPAKGLVVKDVDTASSVHEHFVKCVTPNLWRNYQGQSARVLYHWGVVVPCPGDRMFGPIKP